MELKDFIATSLKSIIEGVIEAQRYAASVGGFINPPDAGASSISKANSGAKRYAEIPGMDIYYYEIHPMEFDIAVTVIDSAGNKGGLGVVMAVAAIGGQRTSEKSTESVSRIRFTVPVAFPHQAKISTTAPDSPPPPGPAFPGPGS